MLTQLGIGRASLAGLSPESFDLSVERAGRFVVRVRHTPYWDGGSGVCVGRAGDWTLVRAPRPGWFACEPDSARERRGARRGGKSGSAERHIAARFLSQIVASSLIFACKFVSVGSRCSG